jgi:transcriptional regulator with XRE-family HTH domain
MDIPDISVRHLGKKIERIRELRGMKQETLAAGLGISQQAVSKMEQSTEIDDKKLKKVADVLGVTVEGIKKFNEELAIYNIQNNYDNTADSMTFQQNSMEKIIELYERILSLERDKVSSLEKELEKFKKK